MSVAAKAPTVKPKAWSNTTKLFAYGTLNIHEIQQMVWGESMQGKPAILNNYELLMWPGSTIFYLEKRPGERVAGKFYELTDEQIKMTDKFEGSAYKRVRVDTEGQGYVETYIRAER